MKFFTWFTPKNKKNVVVPVNNFTEQLHGIDLIKAFSTHDEPKVADFPRNKYKLYWETCIETLHGGYSAVVRFYTFDSNKLYSETTIAKITVEELKAAVNSLIFDTMNQNKR
jgi:hypothetical protein